MQVLHVDLGLATTGHHGTTADPMSWSDVRSLLLALPTTPSAVDLVFRCRGTGALLSTEQSVQLSGLQFTDTTGGIRFIADDPGRYGLPVISTPVFGAGVTALQPNQAWFRVANSTNVRVDFQGFVFDIAQPFGSDGYDLLEVQGGVGSVTNVSRNIFVERGVGHRFVHVHGTDTTAKSVVAGNTVCFGSSSSGAQEFARIETGRLFIGLNYAVQSPTSPAVVMFAAALQQLYTHANAIALRASSLLYTGATPNRYSADLVGIDPLTQGVFNIQEVDPSQGALALANGLSYSEASGLWPVHGGSLFKLGSVQIPASMDLGMTAMDAFGYSRPVSAQDAGAVQKSGRAEPATVHVDLGTGITGGTGSEAAPIGIQEFQIDYGRRAPVDYQLTYVLRGSNTANPLTELDLGPLSPNPAATDLTYTGAGSVTITGYKTYNRKLPILSARRITPNAHMPVVMERLKLEFAGGTDFIVSTILNTSGSFRIRASVMRSRPAAIGMFVRADADTTAVHLHGCTVVQGHSNGTSNGIFSHGRNGDVHLCAINLRNQTAVGLGAADVRACSINTGAAGTAVWTGATVDAFTKLNANNAFVDPDNTDLDAADFQLTAVSDARGVLPDVGSVSADSGDLERDCRGLVRSAFPYGSTAGDAGAYEYDFYAPAPEHRYLDLGKVRQGAGTPTDRWSPADLQAWCDSLSAGTLLDRTIVVHTSRSGYMDLVLRDIDADPNGGLVFVADNGVPLWEAQQRGNILAIASTGLSVSVRGLMLRNTTGAETIRARGCVATDFDVVSSILDHKRTHTVYHVRLLAQPQATDVVTVTGAGTLTFRAGLEYQAGETLALTASALAAAIQASGDCTATATADYVQISVPLTGSASVAGPGLSVELADAVVDVGIARVRGCSVNDEHTGESGVVSVGIRADHADVGYSAFQGHAFSGTTRSGTAIQAAAGSSLNNRANAFTDIVGGGVTDTGSAASGSALFQVPRAADTTVDAFVLANPACVDVQDAASLPEQFQASDNQVDILGRYRSRIYVNPAQNLYDAGAVEQTYLDAAQVFSGEVTSPLTEVTDAGYALNSRALAGDVHFSLVGYAIARGGYVYWDPTKPQPAQDPGAQSHAVLRVVSNTLGAASVTVQGPLGSITVSAGADFDAGTTLVGTAAALATALRSKALFNQGFWCVVDGANVHLYSWRFGTAAGTCSVSVAGSAIQRVQNFVAGANPLGIQDQVYPTTGYAPWFGQEMPDPRSIGLIVRLEDGAFTYGELAVIAKVHDSAFPDEIGAEYVYARVRMPISVKHARRTLIQRVLFAY